jgi:DNA-binding transcriptional LysR family regulator
MAGAQLECELRGRIKLGVPPTVAGYFLPAPLMRFQRSMPPNDPGEALDLFRIAVNGRSQKETRQLAR